MKRLFLFLLFICGVVNLSAQETVLPKSRGAVRIMSYNIRNCRGIDNKTDIDRAARVIIDAAPDVVAIQEIDSAAQRTGRLDMMAELSSRTGMYPIFGPSIDYQGGKYGIGMLSVEEPLSWERISLTGREEARSLLIVEFSKYYVCCAHMTLNEQDQRESVDIIAQKLQSLDLRKRVYLAGDMNTRPNSEITQAFLQNFYMLSDPAQPTFPADNPRGTIDFIYQLRSKRESKVLHYKVMTGRLASDHLPIFVDVK